MLSPITDNFMSFMFVGGDSLVTAEPMGVASPLMRRAEVLKLVKTVVAGLIVSILVSSNV